MQQDSTVLILGAAPWIVTGKKGSLPEPLWILVTESRCVRLREGKESRLETRQQGIVY